MSTKKRNALFRIASQSLRDTHRTPSPLPNTRTIRTHFTPFHSPDLVYLPWLRNDSDHLLSKSVNEVIAARSRDTLWWCVITPIGISPRKTVRNWVERRVRVAFAEALAWRGFNKDGRWIGVSVAHARTPEWLVAAGRPVVEAAESNLVGTLRLSMTDNALVAPIEEIRRDTLTILNALILRQADTGHVQSKPSGVRRPLVARDVEPQNMMRGKS